MSYGDFIPYDPGVQGPQHGVEPPVVYDRGVHGPQHPVEPPSPLPTPTASPAEQAHYGRPVFGGAAGHVPAHRAPSPMTRSTIKPPPAPPVHIRRGPDPLKVMGYVCLVGAILAIFIARQVHDHWALFHRLFW